jgi:hypothetical protein
MNAPRQSNTGKLMGALVVSGLIVIGVVCVWKLTREKPPTAPVVEIPKIGGFSTNEEVKDGAPASVSGPKCLKLDKYFNASLETNWLFGKMRALNFSGLPPGVGDFGGTMFRVGGVVQLSGTGLRTNASRYPNSVEGIPVKMKCAKIHFLHATGWTMPDGAQIGAYIVHFSNGTRQEVPIIYGKDISDWWFPTVAPKDTNPGASTNLAVWSTTTAQGIVALYKSTWENPTPGTEVATIDFISLGSKCAPFLMGITAE